MTHTAPADIHECRVTQVIQLQGADGSKVESWLTLGEVVAVHISKSMLKDGVYDTAGARHIVRGGGAGDYFEIGPEQLFRMARPRQEETGDGTSAGFGSMRRAPIRTLHRLECPAFTGTRVAQ